MIRKIIVVCLVVLLSACAKEALVFNLENEPVITGSGDTPTIDQVRSAVRRAVVKKTWRIRELSPNSFEASYSKGKKIARVTIDFTTKEYNIRYKSSELLLYNGSTIHGRYNAWVRGLRKYINVNLALL